MKLPTLAWSSEANAAHERAATVLASERLSLAALIVLAIGFRLPAFFLMRYGGSAPDWSDYRYYHELAALAAQGFLPDIHFWVEYPPLFPWLAVGLYRLSLLLPAWTQPLFWFDLLLSLVMALADAGSIVAIDRLGDRIWGPGNGRRAAILYAALFLPAYALLGWFDTLPTFFLLAALTLIVAPRPTAGPSSGRLALAGVAAGIGAMLKLFPLLALPAVVAALPHPGDPKGVPGEARPGWRGGLGLRLLPFLTAAATILAIALPFYLLGRDTFLAGFRNVLARGSWMSPWALLDGYYGTGTVASLPDRLYYNPSALWGQPDRFPWLWWLAVLLAGALYLWRGRAALRHGTSRAAIALTGLGVTLLLLLSRGFSTQFSVWLLPFVALLLPDVVGAVFVVLLTLNNLVLEGYLYVSLFPDLHRLLWVSVAVRTVLLLWFAAECAVAIEPKAAARFQRWRRRLVAPAAAVGLAGLVVAFLLIRPSLATAVAARNGDDTLLAAVQASNPSAVVFTQPEVYDRLYRDVQPRAALLYAEPKLLEWTGDRSLDHRLGTALDGQSDVLLVTDFSQSSSKLLPAVRDWLGARYGAEPERKVGGLSLVTYRASLRPTEKPVGARFGPSIELLGYQPSDLTGRPGTALNLTLHWRAAAKVDRDYSVSVQLLDAAGKLVVQHDGMPVNNTVPTSTWQPGANVLDPISLSLPLQLAPGRYQLIVVVYDQQSLQRLPVGAADHVVLGSVQVN